jgi:radical SAM superfamily enzyme YgiQ (UPF0313 family)
MTRGQNFVSHHCVEGSGAPSITAAATDEKLVALGSNIRALLVWPVMARSFWSPERIPGSREASQIPPLGLLTIAALCPERWTLRLVDEQVEPLLDEHLQEADLVMVSGMQLQRNAIRRILQRARELGKRTLVGGPYASSEPEALIPFADHVVIGEPDAVFPQIASWLENGTAPHRIEITEKPDMTAGPLPRFDLLKMDRYATMAIQFSRGCPFQCEFCDIITIYGRVPRTKEPAQVLRELDRLYELGWRKPVFIVDDNFIGNHKRALVLVEHLEEWSRAKSFPFLFVTEASMNLAQRPDLLDAMVKANFFGVFVGIESASAESLKETKKFQNLRTDPIESIRLIQEKGLWVTGGFIIGFDSDTEEIFDLQREFVERAAIPWAMLGFLQAPPTTPLYRRMQQQGRLLADDYTTNFSPPNFRTVIPRRVLISRFRETLLALYEPSAYFARVLRSLDHWHPQGQKPPAMPIWALLKLGLAILWRDGILWEHRKHWWTYVWRARRWRNDPTRRYWSFGLLALARHFISHAADVARELESRLAKGQEEQLVWKALPEVVQISRRS